MCGYRRVSFPPPGTSYTEIHRTGNGGINWSLQISIQEFSYSIYRVFFRNELTGFHNDFSQTSVSRSVTAGSTWSTTSGAGNYLRYYDACFPSANTGWLIGNQNIKTTNGGANWNIVNIPFGNNYNSIFFIDDYTGWVAGIAGIIMKTITGGVTGINPISTELPGSYKLYQNYPNPFNPNSIIKFNILKADKVNLTIFDITGKEIKSLVNEILNAGTYEVDFNGEELSSGIYFYTLKTDDFSDTKKMMLIK